MPDHVDRCKIGRAMPKIPSGSISAPLLGRWFISAGLLPWLAEGNSLIRASMDDLTLCFAGWCIPWVGAFDSEKAGSGNSDRRLLQRYSGRRVPSVLQAVSMQCGGQEQGPLVYYRRYRALRVRMDVDSGKPAPIARCSCLVLPPVIVGDAVFKKRTS